MSQPNTTQRYPAISDLQARAKKRLPFVAWEYLNCGTGDETAVQRNLDGLANVLLLPQFFKGKLEPKIATTLFGQTYAAPFGIAPIGMGGLIWPQVEHYLAQTAARQQIPYTLSTVAAETPETVGPLVGEMGWFQLYSPHAPELRTDILQRAKDSGFKTLVVTADVPARGLRERLTRAGISLPPVITPRFVWQALWRPAWTMATLQRGLPRLRTLQKYAQSDQMTDLTDFLRQNIGGTLSWAYLQEVRDEWAGPLIVKGILHPADAEKAVALGVDGIQVSNHGGRQMNGTPAAIDALPAVVSAVNGRAAVLFDSGIRSGLDIIRALALGADFVILGRAFMYGVAALGRYGGDHVVSLLTTDLENNMIQLGAASLAELKALSVSVSSNSLFSA